MRCVKCNRRNGDREDPGETMSERAVCTTTDDDTRRSPPIPATRKWSSLSPALPAAPILGTVRARDSKRMNQDDVIRGDGTVRDLPAGSAHAEPTSIILQRLTGLGTANLLILRLSGKPPKAVLAQYFSLFLPAPCGIPGIATPFEHGNTRH